MTQVTPDRDQIKYSHDLIRESPFVFAVLTNSSELNMTYHSTRWDARAIPTSALVGSCWCTQQIEEQPSISSKETVVQKPQIVALEGGSFCSLCAKPSHCRTSTALNSFSGLSDWIGRGKNRISTLRTNNRHKALCADGRTTETTIQVCSHLRVFSRGNLASKLMEVNYTLEPLSTEPQQLGCSSPTGCDL